MSISMRNSQRIQCSKYPRLGFLLLLFHHSVNFLEMYSYQRSNINEEGLKTKIPWTEKTTRFMCIMNFKLRIFFLTKELLIWVLLSVLYRVLCFFNIETDITTILKPFSKDITLSFFSQKETFSRLAQFKYFKCCIHFFTTKLFQIAISLHAHVKDIDRSLYIA